MTIIIFQSIHWNYEIWLKNEGGWAPTGVNANHGRDTTKNLKNRRSRPRNFFLLEETLLLRSLLRRAIRAELQKFFQKTSSQKKPRSSLENSSQKKLFLEDLLEQNRFFVFSSRTSSKKTLDQNGEDGAKTLLYLY